MAKRGGLGRGLDSLIPDRVSQKKKKETQKEASEKNEVKSEQNFAQSVSTEPADETRPVPKAEQVLKDQSDTAALSSDGLHAGEESQSAIDLENQKEKKGETVVRLRISVVEPKRDQPRQYFDDSTIDELADSISQYGIISPLLVQKKDDYYEIIAGERRWRAAKKAGLKEVPVIIKNISDREAVEISLIENIQREDLNPMEESRAYERLVKEYGLSQEEVARKVSKSRSAVTNSMRLLKLEQPVQKMVEEGQLSEGHARTIVSIEDPVLQQEVAEQVIESNLSVRQTEMLVKSLQKSDKVPHKKERDLQKETLLQDLADHLKNKLGTKVSIRPRGKNKGRIEIEYYSDEELDRIYELLQSVRQEG